MAAWDPSREGNRLAPAGELDSLIAMRGLQQLLSIYSSGGETLEVRQPLLLGGAKFGTIRIGVSTLLVREEFSGELWLVGATGLVALLIAIVVSASFAQLILRPIHVIRSGLTRLGRGEFGVRLDLNQQDEFGELGTFFNTVSAQLSADRSQMAGPPGGGGGGRAPRPRGGAASYSRKLAALGRLSAGVAHEVKNPLNAMTIHLELLKQKLARAGGASSAAARPRALGWRRRGVRDRRGARARAPCDQWREIQRLDQVMQGLLALARDRGPDTSNAVARRAGGRGRRRHPPGMRGGGGDRRRRGVDRLPPIPGIRRCFVRPC